MAPDLNKGFITNGQTISITTFDLKTFEKTGEPAVGKNPDAVCYEPKTKRVVGVNHTGGDATPQVPQADCGIGPAFEPCVEDADDQHRLR